MTRRHAALAFLIILMMSAAALLTLPARQAGAHCQVPCGIFDDPARIAALLEDAQTIAKAQAEMAELAAKDDVESKQQFVRWVETKEDHASNIITVISEYFLTQKLKPVAPPADGATPEQSAAYTKYLQDLAAHHAVMVAAMRTKQSADPATAQTLTAAITKLEAIWGPPPHEH